MEFLLKIISIHNDKKSSLVNKLLELRPHSKVTNSHINNWLTRDKNIPSDWVLPLCESVDWQVTPHELRPDLYPHPHDGLPEDMRCVCVKDAA